MAPYYFNAYIEFFINDVLVEGLFLTMVILLHLWLSMMV